MLIAQLCITDERCHRGILSISSSLALAVRNMGAMQDLKCHIFLHPLL